MRHPFAPRPTQVAASALTIAAAAAVAVPSAYLLVISAAGLLPRQRRSDGAEPETRFTILVPAHNEAAGIARTLEAFDALDYPSDLFSVHVVADNCSDDTAGVVRRSRWTVHERRAPDDPGKGPALNWLLDELVAGGEPFDAILIVDADSTVAPGFLRAMNQLAREGIQAAQGYYSVRDADLSPAASFRFAALACRHHLRPLGRTRLGGSAGLYGNGMMFTRSLFDGRRWTGHLVEDAELQNELLLEGHVVTYAPDAVLWAEMPESVSQATSQNLRWERGRIELAQRYVPRLLAGLGGARGRRLARVDAVFDHLVPPLSVLATMQLAVAGVHAVGAAVGHRPSRIALVIDAAAIAALAAHTIAGLASVGAPPARYEALLSAPRLVVWKVGVWVKALRPSEEVEWTRTDAKRGDVARDPPPGAALRSADRGPQHERDDRGDRRAGRRRPLVRPLAPDRDHERRLPRERPGERRAARHPSIGRRLSRRRHARRVGRCASRHADHRASRRRGPRAHSSSRPRRRPAGASMCSGRLPPWPTAPRRCSPSVAPERGVVRPRPADPRPHGSRRWRDRGDLGDRRRHLVRRVGEPEAGAIHRHVPRTPRHPGDDRGRRVARHVRRRASSRPGVDAADRNGVDRATRAGTGPARRPLCPRPPGLRPPVGSGMAHGSCATGSAGTSGRRHRGRRRGPARRRNVGRKRLAIAPLAASPSFPSCTCRVARRPRSATRHSPCSSVSSDRLGGATSRCSGSTIRPR